MPQTRAPHTGRHVATHAPVMVWQTSPPVHAPHAPPQPSGPHCRPAHWGAQHAPVIALQRPPVGQLPHDAQPVGSRPHCRPAQLGAQVCIATHAPLVQVSPIAHAGTQPPGIGQAHAPKPEPAALQVCAPLVPPGHAHACVAPGAQTSPFGQPASAAALATAASHATAPTHRSITANLPGARARARRARGGRTQLPGGADYYSMA